MARNGWLDDVAGERMAVDGEFADRVRDSPFSSQQWNLVMTAVTFRIEDAETPADARVVADTSDLDHVASELAAMEGQGSPRGAGTDDASLVDRVTDALGIGGDEGLSAAKREAAEELTAAYAEALQARLEERGRWDEVCATAAGEQ